MKYKSYVKGFMIIIILVVGIIVITACERPAPDSGTEAPEIESATGAEPTAHITRPPETEEAPTATAIPEEPTETAEPTEEVEERPTDEPTATVDAVPEEEPVPVTPSIVITSPLEATSIDTGEPIVVSGTGEGLPEGNVAVEIRDGQGTILAGTATTLQGDNVGLGGAGTWEVTFTINVDSGTDGQVYAFAESPADGSLLASDSKNVSFYEDIPEPFITITSPVSGTVLIDDPFLVTGRGGALFEGNVVVQAEDAAGNILLTQPTILRGLNTGVGGTGDWEITLSVTTTLGTRGRIYAFSTSPADGSVVASDSVNVSFGDLGDSIIHVVQLGENLYRISLLYGVPMADIMAANGLIDPDFVYEGQELIIPIPAPVE